MDVEHLILDEDRQPLPPGETGEIAVKSRYIASGYWRRDDLTRAAFIRDRDDARIRTYLTGDLGLISADGALEYRGRKNQQVKIRGNRVDLTEIETCLVAMEPVKEAAVVVLEDEQHHAHLVAYWTAASETATEHRKIRGALLNVLPVHTVPPIFVKMDKMPLTPTGKIDKRALPQPEQVNGKWSKLK